MLSAQYTFVIATKKLDTHLFSEKIEFANDLHIDKRQKMCYNKRKYANESQIGGAVCQNI